MPSKLIFSVDKLFAKQYYMVYICNGVTVPLDGSTVLPRMVSSMATYWNIEALYLGYSISDSAFSETWSGNHVACKYVIVL